MKKPKTEVSVFVGINKFRVPRTEDENRKKQFPRFLTTTDKLWTTNSVLKEDYNFLLTMAFN